MNISIDMDGVLADFYNPYLERFGTPKDDSEITRNTTRILKYDKDFWLNLPVINELKWTPKQYTTARIIKKQWIKDYLRINMFPKAPIHQIFGYSLSKFPRIKGCHLHIDDSLSVFKDLNSKGLPCLLLDTENNREWGPYGRIYSLDLDEIEDIYHLFLKTIFPHFKELL